MQRPIFCQDITAQRCRSFGYESIESFTRCSIDYVPLGSISNFNDRRHCSDILVLSIESSKIGSDYSHDIRIDMLAEFFSAFQWKCFPCEWIPSFPEASAEFKKLLKSIQFWSRSEEETGIKNPVDVTEVDWNVRFQMCESADKRCFSAPNSYGYGWPK